MRIAIHAEAASGGDGARIGRIGVPVPRGLLHETSATRAVDATGRNLPLQATPLASWPDGSVKWLLADVFVPPAVSRDGGTIYMVDAEVPVSESVVSPAPLVVVQSEDAVDVRSEGFEFGLRRDRASLLAKAIVGGRSLLADEGVHLELRTRDGASLRAVASGIRVELAGPLRVDAVVEGGFGNESNCPLRFQARFSFVATSASVRCELLVRNPRASRHVGGTWDLGDPGSYRLVDLSLVAPLAGRTDCLEWQVDPEAAWHRGTGADPWCLYQDSSGGQCWDSPNHVDAAGHTTVSFRGYEIRIGTGSERVIGRGHRARPIVKASSGEGWVAMTSRAFWENFPKALRWQEGALCLGIFPRECRVGVELQGGEQKRHDVWLEFGPPSPASAFGQMPDPIHLHVDPRWVEASGAVYGLIVERTSPELASYIDQIVDGPQAFAARREAVDEYGWRNFGELYADHEAVHHSGGAPFISHYNNQYDFVLGAGIHALRTGDPRWWRLMDESANHCVDIDIYHTDGDRVAFNGGMFWHSDHYLPAATATHRTYSRHNAAGKDYGGGPSNEHNYTSGLLLHYYLRGDRESRDAVTGLAEWVLAMDDGAKTIYGVFDTGATGLASKTVRMSYHGPGRGAGNSICALLDAYSLTGRRRYMSKAEELIRRCIHPADDVAALGLDEPEHRWSYLVFLQAIGKYLECKRELGEIDYGFHYARESLLRYADWIVRYEVPYRDVLHKVERPTETWSAQDIRKSHVLHLAAEYDHRGLAAGFSGRAGFFHDRCISDLLSFETSGLTRPLVILSVFGHLHDYYLRRSKSDPAVRDWTHAYDFGMPQQFVPQAAGALPAFTRRLAVAWAEILRLLGERASRWRH